MRTLLLVLVLSLVAPLARAQDENPFEVPASVSQRASSALVLVHCLGSSFGDIGVGFAYRDRRHVLTTAWRGHCRSEGFVRVGETRITASRSVVEDELGVALLTLDEDLPDAITPLAPEVFVDPGRGEPLVTFTFAFEHVDYESPFGLARITVTEEDPTRFDSPSGCGGGPVIDRHGHLLGVCTGAWEGAPEPMAEIDAIEKWLSDAPEASAVRRRITANVSEDFGIAFGPGDVLGVGVVLGVTTVFDDVFTLRADVGGFALVHADDPSNDAPVGGRFSTGAYLGLRQAFYFEDGPSLVLSLELGATAGWESLPPAPGGSAFDEHFFVRPALRATARFGASEIGYELQLDPEDPSRSVHLLNLGWTFE